MNGFSLLMVLATVGTTARVETDATGQPTYTIRIESVLIEQLRQGQTIESNVAPADRRTRRFRVLVTDPASRSSGFQTRTDSAARSESLVEYEAVLLENNEIEMWVQISPERLLTLANRPIEGQVPAEVSEIDRYRIFVGVNQLPRQQEAKSAPDSRPPYLLTDNGGLTTAGAEVRTAADTSRRTTPTTNRNPPFQGGTSNFQTGNSAFPAGSSGYQGGYGATAPPLANANTRINDSRTAWRNSPDQSTVSPPPDRFGQSQVVMPSIGNNGAFNTSTTRYDDQYNNSNYNDRNPPMYADRNNAYTYGGNNNIAPPNLGQGNLAQGNLGQGNLGQGNLGQTGFGQSTFGQSQFAAAQQNYPQNQYAGNQGYIQPHTTIASRPDTQLVQQTTPTANNWSQPPVTGGLTATPQPAAPATTATVTAPVAPAITTTVTKQSDDAPKTSTPLILTTLALFTSLGVNAYLGWLAWSFFWRYRDAVNDSARARSYNAPGRQAA